MIYAINKRTKEHRASPSMSELGLLKDWAFLDAGADGWIKWDARPASYQAPVPDGQPCWVRLTNGTTQRIEDPERWDWSLGGDQWVTAYRPILDAEPNGGGAGLGNSFSNALDTMQKAMCGDTEVEWDGESWPPPIGVFVESTAMTVGGMPCEVLAVRKGNVIACCVETGVPGWIREGHCRPIRTAAQRAEEEAVEEMLEITTAMHISDMKEAMQALYRAGYRKEA